MNCGTWKARCEHLESTPQTAHGSSAYIICSQLISSMNWWNSTQISLKTVKFQGKISNSSTFFPRFVVETWAPALSPKVPLTKVPPFQGGSDRHVHCSVEVLSVAPSSLVQGGSVVNKWSLLKNLKILMFCWRKLMMKFFSISRTPKMGPCPACERRLFLRCTMTMMCQKHHVSYQNLIRDAHGCRCHKPDLAIFHWTLKAVASGNLSLAECLTLMARPEKISSKVAIGMAWYSRLLSFCCGGAGTAHGEYDICKCLVFVCSLACATNCLCIDFPLL